MHRDPTTGDVDYSQEEVSALVWAWIDHAFERAHRRCALIDAALQRLGPSHPLLVLDGILADERAPTLGSLPDSVLWRLVQELPDLCTAVRMLATEDIWAHIDDHCAADAQRRADAAHHGEAAEHL